MIISKVPDARCTQKLFHPLLPEWPFHKPASKIEFYSHKKSLFTDKISFIIHKHSAITLIETWEQETSAELIQNRESFVEVESVPHVTIPYFLHKYRNAWITPEV